MGKGNFFMKSLCIKTNNSDLLNYLLNELKNIDLKNICFSENEFKIYKTLEEATTDQKYINKYFSLNCEVVSL